jgi:hypothetical protein
MKKSFLPILLLILTTGVSIAQTHTLKVVVPDTVVACYASGSFCGWASPSENPMEKISDSPKIFTLGITVAEGDVATSEYKYFAGPDWAYEPTDATNFKLTNLDADGDTVKSFKAIWNPGLEKDVTINVLVPANLFRCYMAGSFNGWNATTDLMTLVDSTVNGKEYTLTIHVLDTTTLEFKFLSGPAWTYQQTDRTNYKYITDGGNIVCDVFDAIYDPSKVGDVTINITVPEGTTEVWVVGWNGWDMGTAIQATKNVDGTYTAVIPQVGSFEYKIWCHNDWPYEEAKDAEGNSLDANRIASFESGPVFNITVAYWKQLWVLVNEISTSNYRYYTLDGTIVVEGVLKGISVYDLTGRMVEKSSLPGTFVSKNLKSGIYIIRIDNEAHKIFVQ